MLKLFKGKISLLLSFIMMFTLTSALAVDTPVKLIGDVVFSDDFESGSLGSDWTFGGNGSQDWKVTRDSSSKVVTLGETNAPEKYSLLKYITSPSISSWGNSTISVKLKSPAWNVGVPNGHFTITGRYISGNQSYWLVYSNKSITLSKISPDNNSAVVKLKVVNIEQFKDGSYHELAFGFTDNADGSVTLNGYVDGISKIDYTDTNNPYKTGGFMINVVGAFKSLIDEIKVLSSSTATPAPTATPTPTATPAPIITPAPNTAPDPTATPEDDGDIKVLVNGKRLTFDQPPVIMNDRTLVPMRAIFENFGATVTWDGETNSAKAVKGDITITIPVGSNAAIVNGENVTLDQSAVIMNGRTLVPIRFVSEAFKSIVDWDGSTRTVIIKYSGVSTEEPIKKTIKYNIKKNTGDKAEGGVYLVNDAGAGYGILTELNDVASVTKVRIVTTTDAGETSSSIAEQKLAGKPSDITHTVVALWNAEEKNFKLFVDGIQLGNPITNSAYIKYMRTITKANENIAIDEVKISDTPEAIVTVLSWYTSIGRLVGNKLWSASGGTGYKYEGAKATDGRINYPLTPSEVTLPATSPEIGSVEYYDMMYQSALKYDLPLMKKTGFDAVAFDMIASIKYDATKPITADNTPFSHYNVFLKWVEAAEKLEGIKVGMLLEGAGTTADQTATQLTPEQWTNYFKIALDNLPSSKGLWKIDGRPVITMFGNFYQNKVGGVAPTFGWDQTIKDLRKTNSFYFIPDVNPTMQDYGKYAEIADAAYVFAPAGPTGWLTGRNGPQDYMSMFDKFQNQTEYPKIPFYTMSSPGHYGPAQKSYVQPDFNRIHDVYMKAMESNSTKMQVLTWNDFGEDHDIVPSNNKGKTLVDIYEFYNTWYKTGVKPAAVEDNITICYPKYIADTYTSKPVDWGTGKASPSFIKATDPNRGRVFYWANLKTPQTIQINDFTAIELPAGLSMGELQEAIAPGVVTAKVTSNGKTTQQKLSEIKKISAEGSAEGGMQYKYSRLK